MPYRTLSPPPPYRLPAREALVLLAHHIALGLALLAAWDLWR